jgi:hypothetical protein
VLFLRQPFLLTWIMGLSLTACGRTPFAEIPTNADAESESGFDDDSDDEFGFDSSTPSDLGEDTDSGEDTSDPLPSLLPEAPTLKWSASAIKQFDFEWTPRLGAQYYQLLESPDGIAPHAQVGDDMLGLATSLTVPLHARANASYVVRACNDSGCSESESVNVSGSLAPAIGYFKASNSAPIDMFGSSVALSADGTTLVVGAVYQGENAGNQGAAYVFVRDDLGEWTEQAFLRAPDSVAKGYFAMSVALSADGNILAVGAQGDTHIDSDFWSGAAYVFERDDQGEWSQQAFVEASVTGWWDGFGASVALSSDGTTLAVGAPDEDSNATGIDGDADDDSADGAGAAYVFVHDGQGEWSQQAYVKASNSDSGDSFGQHVALSGDGNTLAVGAASEDSADNSLADAGAVYVLVRDGQGKWSQQAYVKSSNPGYQLRFGTTVALAGDGSTLAVGATGESTFGESSGAAYVLVRDGQGEWSHQARVKALNADPYDRLGQSVSLSADGNMLAAGAGNEDSDAIGIDGNGGNYYYSGAGAAYVFVRDGQGGWAQQAYVKASNTEYLDMFGKSVALSGDGETLAVGAAWEDSNATGIAGQQADNSHPDAGAVYLY